MRVSGLSEKTCAPCQGGMKALPLVTAQGMARDLHADWQVASGTLKRRLEFKGFAKAVLHANLAAFVGDKQGHHPDIAFGWGYCEIVFTTHEAGGLTENDFICAARFDAACV
jgi:4a-hydroxytetrahydrobiopterin dehydratase